MKDGIYEGLSFQDYCAIEAINKSGLDQIQRSPAHFIAYKSGTQREATPAMRLGSAIHCAVLEPNSFSARYVCEPKDPPRRPTAAQINAKKPSEETIESIRFWTEFNETSLGRDILSAADWEKCHRIASRLKEKATAQEFFSDGKFEVTLVWTDPLTGAKCKGRLDWVTNGALVDLKSTICADPREWWREVKKYNLHCQAAWYSDGWKVLTGEEVVFVFAAVEKEEPYAGGFFVGKERVVELGRSINRRNLKKFVECTEKCEWPGYKDELVEFDFPEFMFKEEPQTLEEY